MSAMETGYSFDPFAESAPPRAQPAVFTPQAAAAPNQDFVQFYSAPQTLLEGNEIQRSVNTDIEDFDNEPPLLEELGIDFSHIGRRVKLALLPRSTIEVGLLKDSDLAGPIAICLSLGVLMLLRGKIQFGYIYGFAMGGSILMYCLLNLLCPNGAIELCHTTSILGYSLLPINLSFWGYVVTLLVLLWCTVSATSFFEQVLTLRPQRYLIGYPAFLYFMCFAQLAIF